MAAWSPRSLARQPSASPGSRSINSNHRAASRSEPEPRPPAEDMVGGVADAVVIPGGMFGPAAGLLMYTAAVAERRAGTVHRHWWSQPPPDPFDPHIEDWVRNEVSPLLEAVGGTPMLIAKSLGTNAAAVAA